MGYTVIKVETANIALSSICQIGIVAYKDGKVVDRFLSLVNPQDEFGQPHELAHDITQEDVRNAPTFGEISKQVSEMLEGSICVVHSLFERNSILLSYAKQNIYYPKCRWLDITQLLRKEIGSYTGQKLIKNFVADLSIENKYNNALSYAENTVKALNGLILESEWNIQDWLNRLHDSTGSPTYGLMFGEKIVITEKLHVPTTQITEIYNQFDCKLSEVITENTSIVVLGSRNNSNAIKIEYKPFQRNKLMPIGIGQTMLVSEPDFLAITLNLIDELLDLKFYKAQERSLARELLRQKTLLLSFLLNERLFKNFPLINDFSLFADFLHSNNFDEKLVGHRNLSLIAFAATRNIEHVRAINSLVNGYDEPAEACDFLIKYISWHPLIALGIDWVKVCENNKLNEKKAGQTLNSIGNIEDRFGAFAGGSSGKVQFGMTGVSSAGNDGGDWGNRLDDYGGAYWEAYMGGPDWVENI